MKDKDNLIRLPEVERRIGLRKTAIYAMIKRNEFPRQIKIGSVTVWSENQINAWIDERKSA